MRNDYLDYLQHSGVKGQKWGNRRWQNEDGSLTAEGYEHYGYGRGDDRRGSRYESDGRRDDRYSAPQDTYNHRMSTINTRSAKEIMSIGNKQYGLNKTNDFAKKRGSSLFKTLVTSAAVAAFVVSGFKAVNSFTTTTTTITKNKKNKTVNTEITSRRY